MPFYAFSHFGRYLGNIYTAEAMVMLGKPMEAAQFLSPEALELSNESTPEGPQLTGSRGESINIRHALALNLAVVSVLRVGVLQWWFLTFLLQDELTQAEQYLNQALALGYSTQAVLLRVYIDLRRGNIQQAVHTLKTNGCTLRSQKEQ